MKVGEKYGCLVILDEGEEYIQLVDDQIAEIAEEKADFERLIENDKLKRRDWCSLGEEAFSFVYIPAYIYDPKSFKKDHDSVRVEDFNEAIEDKRKERTIKKYKCKCRHCGKIRYYAEETIQTGPTFCYRPVYISTKHTYSTRASNATHRKEKRYQNNETICFVDNKSDFIPSDEYCDKWNEKRGRELKKQAEKEAAVIASLPRKHAENYDVDFIGLIYESLEVLECVNETLESDPDFDYDQRHRKIYHDITVYKQYRCRCYLCGKEKMITCDEFGKTTMCCDCHKTSLFQMTVNKVLIEYNVPYRVEVSFLDLYGVQRKKRLQFDFAVYGENDTIKCLIECQGKQHYEQVDEFGGEYQFEIQKANDELKHEYAKAHGIPLIEISYQDKSYVKIKEILQKNGIL